MMVHTISCAMLCLQRNDFIGPEQGRLEVRVASLSSRWSVVTIYYVRRENLLQSVKPPQEQGTHYLPVRQMNITEENLTRILRNDIGKVLNNVYST